MEDIIEIHLEGVEEIKDSKAEQADTLYEQREKMVNISCSGNMRRADVTILINGYNRLEKTKRCVESVLKYTEGIDYELLLVDNGSSDDKIFEYFKQVNYPKKRILRIEKSEGSTFLYNFISLDWIMPYLVYVLNDLIVTKNWLSNMLKIMESDKKIGLVAPMSDNTWPSQDPGIKYNSYEEMQERAVEFNISDPQKWYERMYFNSIGFLIRKECLYVIGWPYFDCGFSHYFGDNDLAQRIRRGGYKIVVAGDTFICHDHPESMGMTYEQIQSFLKAVANFNQKYYLNIRSFDIDNHILLHIKESVKNISADSVNILGIDTMLGISLLDMKNMVRQNGVFNAELSAFTQDDRYCVDLRTICDGNVVCDREEFLKDSFRRDYFDYIIIDREINRYHEPIKVLLDAYDLLKPGGQMIFNLKNTQTIFTFLSMLGVADDNEQEPAYNYDVDKFLNSLKSLGFSISVISCFRSSGFDQETYNLIKDILIGVGLKEDDEKFKRLFVDKFWFSIEK